MGEQLRFEEKWSVKKESSKVPRVIGIAGRKGSGKTTMAQIVASRISGSMVASFASALKGGVLDTYGILSFFPQLDGEVRQVLQEKGVLGREIMEDLWIKCLTATHPTDSILIIADVRFENEVEFIRRSGGFVIYLLNLDAEEDTHISEQLSPDFCDYVVVFTKKDRSEATELVLKYVSERVPQFDWNLKPKVYISSNIAFNDQDDIISLAEEGEESGFECIVPPDIEDRQRFVRSLSEKNFSEVCREIVVSDLKLIAQAHSFFLSLHKPSIGCSMELLAAAVLGKVRVSVVPLELVTHPWLWCMGGHIFWGDRKKAWEFLRRLFLISP